MGTVVTDSSANEQPEQSDRDHLISKRRSRFLQYWEGLQRDFLLPKLVNGNEIQFTVYQGYAPFLEVERYRTIALQGWLGAGKTEMVLQSLNQDKPTVWVAPRNGLLRQTGERARKLDFENVYYYQENPGKYRMMLEAGMPGIYLMCPDSFKSYAVGNLPWKNIDLVIDEFSGSRREVLKKDAELPQFLDAIARSGTLIAADAFLSEIDIRIIQKYRSGSLHILRQKVTTQAKSAEF